MVMCHARLSSQMVVTQQRVVEYVSAVEIKGVVARQIWNEVLTLRKLFTLSEPSVPSS